ncbi:MAG: hypothetical protein JRJ39_02895, partial [Deltaproteobacteria bacterium]|nr:hypothetical protein [Deltaproteobacteria bacterium]
KALLVLLISLHFYYLADNFAYRKITDETGCPGKTKSTPMRASNLAGNA